MKISKLRFISIFILSAFIFQFVSNSLLSNEPGLFAKNNEWYPGLTSSVTWQSTLAKIIHPLKLVLLGPPAAVLNDPDPAPPILLMCFGLYWTLMAAVIYYLVGIFKRKKSKIIDFE
jgi:hypothetical protein